MARITINFIGQWRLYLGEEPVTAEAETIKDVRDLVENHFGPVFREKMRSKGIGKNTSVWENSNILLNGRNIKQLAEQVLEDGDIVDLLPRMAGG